MSLATTVRHFVALTKPRITAMVLVASSLGFLSGAANEHTVKSCFAFFLLGTALACSGAAVLNQVLERDIDALMRRTKTRPLPLGEVSLGHAILFGVSLVVSGTVYLAWSVNLLTAYLALLTAFLYVVVYTPLKRVTWLNTAVGAVPGALPPLGGYAAATDSLGAVGFVLFAILFVWQHPHFYAIAWMYREDYRRAGIQVLPVVEPDGISTFRQIYWFSALLIPVSLVPIFFGLGGSLYATGALIAGALALLPARRVGRTRTSSDARAVLRASVIYLPALFILLLVDIYAV